MRKRYGSEHHGGRSRIALRVSQVGFEFFAHVPAKNRVPTMPEQRIERFGCQKRRMVSHRPAHFSAGNRPSTRASQSIPSGKGRVRSLDRDPGADRTGLRARAGTRVRQECTQTLRQRSPQFGRENRRLCEWRLNVGRLRFLWAA
jgi:hypothetical protein